MATKDIADAAKPIRENWDEIRQTYAKYNPGKYLSLTSVHRPPEEQFSLYKKGRKQNPDGTWVVVDKSQVVTNVDGYKIKGAHNYMPSRAIDVAVVNNQTGKVSWKESDYFSLGTIAKSVGLEWGGNWKSIKDYPHLEIPDYKNYKG